MSEYQVNPLNPNILAGRERKGKMHLLVLAILYAVALWVAMQNMNVKGEFWKIIIIALVSTGVLLIPGRFGLY